jgi:hypothetical protein
MNTIQRLILHRHVAFLLITVLLLMSGCATTVDVNVNSIVDPSMAHMGKRYVLINGNNEKAQDDLFFREFSRYFDAALKQAGYEKVSNRDDADLDIYFKYGISDGRTGVYSYASPIYDFVGGESITITENTGGTTGQKVTTIHIPSRLERVGTDVQTRNYVLYNRTASLEARAVSKEEESAAQKKKNPLVWSVYVYSVGESNDLRQIMPYLAAAAEPYIGLNTGQQINVALKHDSPEVLKLKALTTNGNTE